MAAKFVTGRRAPADEGGERPSSGGSLPMTKRADMGGYFDAASAALSEASKR